MSWRRLEHETQALLKGREAPASLATFQETLAKYAGAAEDMEEMESSQ